MDRVTITKQKCSTFTNNLHINLITVNLIKPPFLYSTYLQSSSSVPYRNIWTMYLVKSSYVSNIWYWHLDSETESKWEIVEITEMT